jgi:pimeloyl-ACP methyl ester carboxylesterase
VDAQLLTLADGRRLSWAEQGDPTGSPVLALHGSPGSRFNRYPYPDDLAAAGIRQITYDRPGYGLSDAHPGRSVADAVADILQLLDALALDRVAVIGASGGAPHALALASLAPDRCTQVRCCVGIAPFDAPDLDFFAGMDPANVRRFRSALLGREAALPQLTAEVRQLADDAERGPDAIFSDMQLPESDRSVLRELHVHMARGLREATRQGGVGATDDLVAFTKPWGFDPQTVRAEVVIEYGEADVNVPATHGQWLASHVPNVAVVVNPEAGHLTPPERMLEILRLLASGSQV